MLNCSKGLTVKTRTLCFLDNPMVISGNTVLLIDPHQPADKVNAMMNLNELPTMSGIDLNACMETLDKTFGFGRHCIDNNYFPGTLFWFPLRETESDLSSTLYDKEKVMELFEVFKEEASNILIFLKNLASIKLYTCSENKKTEKMGEVRIIDEDGSVDNARRDLKNRLAEISQNEDMTFPIEMTIRTEFPAAVEERRWLVVNHVVGKSASTNFRKLIRDKSLGYSPCVGVATCLDPTISVEGHIFCFLPLPKEGSRHTGLPMHVNGFFALNQNRHHLKWATDQQKGKKIDDKSILWNEKMITEALPRAYQQLVLTIIRSCNQKECSETFVRLVYRLIPDSTLIVDTKWKQFVSRAVERLSDQNIFYCKHFNAWVSVQEAIFATFNGLPASAEFVTGPVKRCLSMLGKYAVDVDTKVLDTLKPYFKGLTEISPAILSSLLKNDTEYTQLDNDSKHAILAYLLLDKDVKKIQDLELMHLQSGDWTKFKRHGTVIFVAKENEHALFPGFEDRFLSNDTFQHSASSNALTSFIRKGKHCKRDYLNHYKQFSRPPLRWN